MTRTPLGRGLALATVMLAGVAAAKTINQVIAARAPALPAGPPDEEAFYDWSEGAIRYTEAGAGQPVLLVHGLRLGGSAAEWRDNAGPLTDQFRVYTVDLLGFGRSAKPALHYTGELYVRLLRDFIRDVIEQPVNVVASGISAAHLVALACREPAWFRQLILVCPTGIQAMAGRPTAAGRSLYQSLSTPILGESIYNTLASRARIELALRHEIYHDGSRVDADLVERVWNAAHQPGAIWAARSLLTGYLNINICEEFRRLERPVTLVWGQRAQRTPVSQAEPFLKVNPDAELEIFNQSGLLPHDERPEEFNRMIEERLNGACAYVGQLPRPDLG